MFVPRFELILGCFSFYDYGIVRSIEYNLDLEIHVYNSITFSGQYDQIRRTPQGVQGLCSERL